MALSNGSVERPRSSFANGIEFEETFPEVAALLAAQPAPVREPATSPAPVRESARVPAPAKAASPAPAIPRLTVLRSEPTVQDSEALFQERLDRRLREAEAMVQQTIESVRLEEEKRLAEWVRTRQEDEERRLAKWTDERRAAVERSLQERVAERQRTGDEERLRTWRGDLERAVGQRAIHRRAIAGANSARDVGRILRDAISELIHTSALALAVHHERGDEVAYRYRVASEDEVGQLLRHEALDDGPASAVAHMNSWVRAQRTVRAGTRNATVHAAQLAVRDRDVTIGVLTLQTDGRQIDDSVLARVAELAAAAAPRLAAFRDSGNLRGA